MSDGYLDNPAGRLVALFDAAKLRPENEAAVNGWAEVFGYANSNAAADSTSELARVVLSDAVALMDEVAEVRRLVEELPDDPDTYLEHFPEVESTASMFGALLTHNMGSFMKPYLPTARQCLRMCSSLLHKHRPEPTIAPDQREHLLTQVDGLQHDINADPDLPDDVKSYVTARLQEVFNALGDYRQTGSRRVEEATNALVGSMATRPDVWGKLPVKWVKRIAIAAAAVTWALNTAVSAKELLPATEPDPQPIVQVYCIGTGADPTAIDHADDGEIYDAEIVETHPPR